MQGIVNPHKQKHIILDHPPLVDATYEQLRSLIRDEGMNNNVKNPDLLKTFYVEINKLEEMENYPVKFIKKHALFYAPRLKLNYLYSLDDKTQLSAEELEKLVKRVYNDIELPIDIPFPMTPELILRKKKSILNTFYVFLEFHKNGFRPFGYENLKINGE